MGRTRLAPCALNQLACAAARLVAASCPATESSSLRRRPRSSDAADAAASRVRRRASSSRSTSARAAAASRARSASRPRRICSDAGRCSSTPLSSPQPPAHLRELRFKALALFGTDARDLAQAQAFETRLHLGVGALVRTPLVSLQLGRKARAKLGDLDGTRHARISLCKLGGQRCRPRRSGAAAFT